MKRFGGSGRHHFILNRQVSKSEPIGPGAGRAAFVGERKKLEMSEIRSGEKEEKEGRARRSEGFLEGLFLKNWSVKTPGFF